MKPVIETDEDRLALLDVILRGAKLLGAVGMSKGVRVAGPWLPAERPSLRVVHGMWRLTPNGKEVVTVWPSLSLESRYPNQDNYIDYDENDLDEEDWRRALEAYNALQEVWKPWSYGSMGNEDHGWADTKEEAMAKADNDLRSEGVLLLDDPVLHKKEPGKSLMELLLDEG